MIYAGVVKIDQDVPRIALEVRLINGVPCLFTERGEYVNGQQRVAVVAEPNSAVYAEAKVLIERAD